LQELWNESCSQVADNEESFSFARLELEDDDDIVLEVKTAIEAQKEVMATHAISKAYNILPPNPKYRSRR
jgi:hypothetical protein